MARPRKDTAVKQAQGTATPSREAARLNLMSLLPADDELPQPYSSLTPRQSELFFKIASELQASLPLMKIDTYLIQNFAIAAETAERAKYQIDETGILNYTASGNAVKSPAWTVYTEATKIMSDLSVKLGLSPAARVNLIGSLTPPKKAHDPLDSL